MDHVVIRRLEQLTGTKSAPRIGFAIETRDRAGPAHKHGAFDGDTVWVQLHGGLFVARARVRICWIGEYSSVREIRERTRGSDIYGVESFWEGRPRYGYAAVAQLQHETWIDPFWSGPRTYGYEWVVLEDSKKRAAWLDPKDPPRGAGADLESRFRQWLAAR